MFLAALLALPGARADIKFPVKLQEDGFLAGIWDVGELRISGQPTPAAFRKLAADGVKTVICLRGTEEMNDRTVVDFDESELLKELAITYVHIPVGKAEEYNFSAVKRFAAALENAKSKGKVLLHCTVGWRASYVWGTYLHKFRNYEIDEAIRTAEAMNASANRVELLLGTKVSYETTPKLAQHLKPIKPFANKTISPPRPLFPPKEDAFMDWTVWEMGDVLNGSQPNEQQLKDLVAAKGITTVINIRTAEEMAYVKKETGFDEEAVARQLGLTYVNVPLQALETFTPSNLERIANAIKNSKGRVLLHCNTATRTSSVWAAYLTKYGGVELNEAMKHALAMRLQNPFTDFLEIDLVYKVKSTPMPATCGGGGI
jgi:uncharacterized protein (TIGR01244 family)